MAPTDATNVPQPPRTPIGALGVALSMVFQAKVLALQGLNNNPSKEEERELNDTIHDLELQRFAIIAKMDALIDKKPGVAGPTPTQVAQVSALTVQVGAQTNASVTASAAVALTTRVLALASQVAAG